MRMVSLIKLVCVVVMCMGVVGAPLAHAITCGEVQRNLAPCLGYLQRGGAVPPGCCAGIRYIAAAARTTMDRKATCNCIKSTAAQMHGLNLRNAQSLPGICRVNIPYKISTSINCASIK